MKTLLGVEQTALCIMITQPPTPWKSKISVSFFISRPNNNSSNNLKKTWKIHAKAKGFNRANLEQQKLLLKEERKKALQDEADGKIPDEVMNRMITRILFNVGVPLVTGLVLLQVFSVIKEQNLWQVPRWLPFLTTFITFGASTLGIAYGTLSTSWDEEKKGSVLGLEEAKKNWAEMWREDDDDD